MYKRDVFFWWVLPLGPTTFALHGTANANSEWCTWYTHQGNWLNDISCMLAFSFYIFDSMWPININEIHWTVLWHCCCVGKVCETIHAIQTWLQVWKQFSCAFGSSPYCWWKNSYTTWDVFIILGWTTIPTNWCRISSIHDVLDSQFVSKLFIFGGYLWIKDIGKMK